MAMPKSTSSACYSPATGIYTSPRPPINFPSDPNLSMLSLLFRNIKRHPNRPALIDAESSQTLTFQQLQSTVASFASALSNLGISKGDVVLLFAPNSILFPVSFLSIISLGAIATTVNPQYTVHELSKQVQDSAAKLVLTTPELVPKAASLNLPIVLLTKNAENSISIPSFCDLIKNILSSEFKPPAIKQSDTAALLYSSGTTGTSKGVVLTHRNFICTAVMLSADQDEAIEPARIYLCFLPMFHVSGLGAMSYAQLQRGNTVVVMERFDMGKMLGAIERFRVTHLFVVPPVMVRLAKQGTVSNYDVGSLRSICTGAAPIGSDLMEKVSDIFPNAQVVQGYGLTETCSAISMECPTGGPRQFGSTGYLRSGIEAKVISVDTSKPVPPNQKGELLFRGPNIMKGYFNDPEATKITLDEEGWLHSGDLGYFDEKGQLYVQDRIKELIKCKGFQVAPAELEAVLTSHPEILDAAVVPMDDAEAGQLPVAFVVPRSNSLTEVNVQKFVANQVAPYKRLRWVIFEKSIPKTASGKILRRELADKVNTLRRELTEKGKSKL